VWREEIRVMSMRMLINIMLRSDSLTKFSLCKSNSWCKEGGSPDALRPERGVVELKCDYILFKIIDHNNEVGMSRIRS
jgi:hypothetical protein